MENYFNLNVEVELKKDVELDKCGYFVSSMIAQAFCKCEEGKIFHESKESKNFTTSLLKGYVKNNKFESEKRYFFDLRSSNQKLIMYLKRYLPLVDNAYVKILNVGLEIIEVPEKVVNVKTLSPFILVLKNEKTEKEVIKKLSENAIKRYVEYTKEEIPRDLIFINKIIKTKSVICKAKKYTILGTKAKIEFKQDELSQKLAKFVYLNGLGHKTSYLSAGHLGLLEGGI